MILICVNYWELLILVCSVYTYCAVAMHTTIYISHH